MSNHEEVKKNPIFSCDTTMDSNEVLFLISKLKRSKNYLEYGSGYSTIEACKFVKSKIFSIETSLDYIDFMKKEIKSRKLDLNKVSFIHSHVGDTGIWGYPVDQKAITDWPKYASNWLEIQASGQFKPDLVLIDGRFRVATFAWLYLTRPGLQILFDDYLDRPQYHIVETLTKPRTRVGRIALFRIQRFRSSKKIKQAVKILMNQLLNPE
jgi:hypothetical protein